MATDPKRVYYVGAGCNPCVLPGLLFLLTRPCLRPCPSLRLPDGMLDGLRQGLVRYIPSRFRPYRPISALFKSLRVVQPDFVLWRDFHYEYEPAHRRPIDIINGGPSLREWVDDPRASIGDWDQALRHDEATWIEERQPFLIYTSSVN